MREGAGGAGGGSGEAAAAAVATVAGRVEGRVPIALRRERRALQSATEHGMLFVSVDEFCEANSLLVATKAKLAATTEELEAHRSKLEEVGKINGVDVYRKSRSSRVVKLCVLVGGWCCSAVENHQLFIQEK